MLLVCSIPLVIAGEIDEQFDEVVRVAERYETGEITYFELLVGINDIKEQLNDVLREQAFEIKVGNETHGRGLTVEGARLLFGEQPTEMTSWVWAEDANKEIKLPEAVPRWEKSIFDGHKIHLGFHAWPHVLHRDGENQLFYRVEVEPKFKKALGADVDDIIKEVQNAVEKYHQTVVCTERQDEMHQPWECSGDDAQVRELIEIVASAENKFFGYVEQNRENCDYVMEQFFSSDERAGEQEERIRWQVPVYKGDRTDVTLQVDICDGCEWPWINMWPNLERFPLPEPEHNIDYEIYRENTIDELNTELEILLDDLVSIAEELDSKRGLDDGLLQSFNEKQQLIQMVNSHLDERYYHDENVRQGNYERRIEHLESIFSKYGEFERSPFREVRFEKVLVKDEFERINNWCQQNEEITCQLDEGCRSGECVYALGGAEECNNGIDDDGDEIIDCLDPDCARECGKICEPACSGENGCWEVSNNECSGVCQECWECNGDDCGEICDRTCNSCMDKFRSEPVCRECKICEDREYGSGCFETCEPCEQCKNENPDDVDGVCFDLCESCNGCEKVSGQQQCEETCGDDEFCITQCQPADEEIYCNEGFNDCDNDGDCETVGACLVGGEICDDTIDNNEDGFVDCEELNQCGGHICDFKGDTTKVCHQGECVLHETIMGPDDEKQEDEIEEDEPVDGGEPEDGGGGCVVVEDCNNNEVCSLGVCKVLEISEPTIPQPEVLGEPGDQETPADENEDEPVEEIDEEPLLEEPAEPIEDEDPVPEEPIRDPEPTPEPEPVVEEPAGITGAFSAMNLITGNAIGFAIDDIEEDNRCNQNQNYDSHQDQCHCIPGFADCNEDQNDGCEASDVTCDGRFEICPGGCRENQECREDYGWCECAEGHHDCDGDWENGCESTTECTGCITDNDCAPQRCSEYDNRVVSFSCVEGDKWVEDRGQFQFAGGCSYHPTGRVDTYVNFDAWGDSFEDFNQLRKGHFGGDWCEFELEGLRRERTELAESINDEMLAWFYDQYIQETPGKWEQHIDGIWAVYGRLTDVNSRIAGATNCLGEQGWPQDLEPIQAEYDGEFGSVEIFEELKQVDAKRLHFGDQTESDTVEVLSPYMKIWIFPPEEFIKQEFKESLARGELPGPREREKKTPGLTRDELQRIRNDQQAMETIQNLVDEFGEDVRFKLIFEDENEVLGEILFTVNERDLVQIKSGTKTSDEEIDVVGTVEFEFLYDMMTIGEKDKAQRRIEVPYWEDRRGGVIEGISDTKDGIVMFTKMVNGIRSKKLRTEPKFGVFRTMGLIGDISDIIDTGKGKERRDGPKEGFDEFEE